MQPMPQYPQPPIANRNPFFEWLKQARRDFSRIGASLCLMVVVWYALATVLEGALYAAVGGKGETPWAARAKRRIGLRMWVRVYRCT